MKEIMATDFLQKLPRGLPKGERLGCILNGGRSLLHLPKSIVMCVPLLLFASCMVGPRYKKPQVNLPDKFSEEKNKRTIAELENWWTFFEDPYLNNLIKKAINKNYDLQLALEKINQMRATYGLQSAQLNPEIDITGSITQRKLNSTLIEDSFFPMKNISYQGIGFNASWEIDFWGKLRHAKKAAYHNYMAQIETMRDIYIILLSNVAKAYIDIRSIQKKIDLVNEQIALDTKLLALAKDRFKSGVASELPDLEEQAALNESKNQRLLLEITFKQTVNGLAILLGENPEDLKLQAGNHAVPQSKKELKAGLPSDLLRRRPDIRQAEHLLMAATESIGQAYAQYFPSFSLLGNTNLESNYGSKWLTSKSIDWMIGPSIRWPILTFGRIKYQVREAKSIQKQALLTYGKTIINALGDVENALVSYFKEKEQVRVLQEKLAALDKERTLTKALHASGLANKSDVLQIKKSYLTIALQLTDAQEALSSSLILVYKSLGGDW